MQDITSTSNEEVPVMPAPVSEPTPTEIVSQHLNTSNEEVPVMSAPVSDPIPTETATEDLKRPKRPYVNEKREQNKNLNYKENHTKSMLKINLEGGVNSQDQQRNTVTCVPNIQIQKIQLISVGY